MISQNRANNSYNRDDVKHELGALSVSANLAKYFRERPIRQDKETGWFHLYDREDKPLTVGARRYEAYTAAEAAAEREFLARYGVFSATVWADPAGEPGRVMTGTAEQAVVSEILRSLTPARTATVI